MSENQQSQSPQLFQQPGPMELAADQAGIARATQEVQAALVIAKRYPRDEIKAIEKIVKACSRPGLAEVAEYEYNRGGTKITGPSIDLLIAVANRWGNILYGWSEVERNNGQSKVRAYAWDIENNGRAEREFFIRHWRDTQGGGYALKDERDIYELLANQASRRVRSCLEQVIDQDVVDMALDQCHKTLRGQSQVPLRDRAVQMVVSFAELGVTQAMIEKRLGNKLEAVSENQLASLRRVYKAIRDGVGPREDYFKAENAEPDLAGGGSAQTKPETTEAVHTGGSTPGAVPEVPPPAKTKKATLQKGEAHSYVDETPLAKVRRLAKDAKLAEGKLLEWLAFTGSTDGSPSSLEELAMQFPSVLKLVADQFADILERMKG